MLNGKGCVMSNGSKIKLTPTDTPNHQIHSSNKSITKPTYSTSPNLGLSFRSYSSISEILYIWPFRNISSRERAPKKCMHYFIYLHEKWSQVCPPGPMDKAPAYGAGDSRFDPGGGYPFECNILLARKPSSIHALLLLASCDIPADSSTSGPLHTSDTHRFVDRCL